MFKYYLKLKKELMRTLDLILFSTMIFFTCLPHSPLAQNSYPIDWIIKDFNFKDSMDMQFGSEKVDKMMEMYSDMEIYSLGILQFSSPEIDKRNLENFPSSCQCILEGDSLQISNAIGFKAGIASVTKIDIERNSAISYIQLISDGVKSNKLNQEDEYIANLKIPFINLKIEILDSSKFLHGDLVTGRLTGKTERYYQKSYSKQEDQVLSLIVKSIFQCKVFDPKIMDFELRKTNKKKN